LVAVSAIQALLWNRSLRVLLGINKAQYIHALSKSALVTLASVLPIIPLWLTYENPWNIPVNEFLLAALGAVGAWVIALWMTRHPLANEITSLLQQVLRKRLTVAP
jgi:hypothetical protein